MATYETSATVEDQGRVQVVGVPFAAGTQVDISISPKRLSVEEFKAAWQRLVPSCEAAQVCGTLTKMQSAMRSIGTGPDHEGSDRYQRPVVSSTS